MSSTVALNTRSLSRSESNVTAALGEVAVAFKHLAVALVSSKPSVQSPLLTAQQEAEELRSYAAEIQSKDPNFAQDLFAAADRHEIEAATATVH